MPTPGSWGPLKLPSHNLCSWTQSITRRRKCGEDLRPWSVCCLEVPPHPALTLIFSAQETTAASNVSQISESPPCTGYSPAQQWGGFSPLSSQATQQEDLMASSQKTRPNRSFWRSCHILPKHSERETLIVYSIPVPRQHPRSPHQVSRWERCLQGV